MKPFDYNKIDDWLKVVETLKIRFPVAEIAQKTGYNKSHVSALLNKKTALSPNFLKKFNEAYPGLNYDLGSEIDDFEKNNLMEPSPAYETSHHQNGKNNVSNQSILNLTEANMLLAQAQKIFAESQSKYAEANLTLAKTNQELVEIAKGSVPSLTENFEVFDARYADFLELLADVASGKRYGSKQEALASLNNMFHGNFANRPARGTQKN